MMLIKTLREKIKFLSNYSIMIPLLVLVIMGLSFGIVVSKLGFYMDDWPNVFFQAVKGSASTYLFHAYDGRPLQSWYQVFVFNFLGTNPIRWQIYSLALRYLTVIVTWLIFRRLWPKSELVVGLAAILFAVYPIFAQQQLAYTFSAHWTSFLCLVVSIYLMLISVDHPKWFVPITLVSMGISAMGLTIIEYFIGLEFARPIFLWIVFSKKIETNKQKLPKILKYYFPYFLIAAGFIVWRMFIVKLPVADRNEISIFSSMMDTPLKSVLNLIKISFQDLLMIIVSGWFNTIQPTILNFKGPVDYLAVGIVIAIVLMLLWVFFKFLHTSKTDQPVDSVLLKEQIYTGLLLTLLGAVPGWLIGRQVSDPSGLWNDRFGLASMAGAALLVIAFLVYGFMKPRVGLITAIILIGLASGWQFRNADDFRWSWKFQKRFFNQLIWRAPDLAPDTLILSEKELFPKMGVYPTSFAINTMYPQSHDTDQVDYWFLTITKFFSNDMESFMEGNLVEADHWQAWFKGNTSHSIVLYFPSDGSHCLWVLNSDDSKNPRISEVTAKSLPISNLSLISQNYSGEDPGRDIVKGESQDSWCYYFEKADLAQQFKDWESVARIWEEAKPYLDFMNSGIELSPFISGFIHQGQYQQAAELTTRAMLYGVDMHPYLCELWKKGLFGITPDVSDQKTIESVSINLQCELP